MKTRPLCFVCLLFIIIQSILLIMTSGESLYEIPASSIFFEREKKTVCIQGQVYKKANTSNFQILYLKNNSVRDSKFMIYDENFIEVSIGETVTMNGTIGFFDTARNPGNYDQALYYARQDIYGFIWCNHVQEVSGEANVLMESLYQYKTKWKEKLIDTIGDKNGAILAAMLLGEKSEMDTEIKELYQKNGIGHVLAISGLHISFIGLGIYKLVRRTGLGFLPSGLFAVGLLSLYVLMIGFSVSVVRAYVMLILRIGADMSGRVYDMFTALMLAAALTIGYQPLYLTDGGFWMSYGAILGILLILPALQKCFPYRWKWVSGLLSSLTINIMLLPVLMWFYFEFPTYSLFLNMLVIPLMSVVLGFGMIGSFLLTWIPPAGWLCLKLCGWILELFEWISRVGSELPMARLVLGQPDLWTIILYYITLLSILVYIYRSKKSKKYVWLSLVIVVAFMVYQPKGELTVTMLDVGQGDGIFLCGPKGTTYLIDGGSSDVDQLGKYRIEPFLKSQGVGVLDYVFVSHGDSDHYSGILEMLERQAVGVRIENLIFPANYQQDKNLISLVQIARENGTQTLVMEAGEELSEGELFVRCLQPSVTESGLEGNVGSMVLEVVFHEFSMLCTGDVEEEGEEALLSKIQGKRYDVLKVAHHGSKNSTSESLLAVIQPKIALISAGRDNSYGHPHEEVLQRLEKVKSQIFTTQEKGAITLITDGNSCKQLHFGKSIVRQ